jgi:hypothetical protein
MAAGGPNLPHECCILLHCLAICVSCKAFHPEVLSVAARQPPQVTAGDLQTLLLRVQAVGALKRWSCRCFSLAGECWR